jgi:hypothetical protein
MGFFEDYFDVVDGSTEVNVACPFPHHTANGIEYIESNPSAHVNTRDRVFHCKACGTGHSETSFIETILGCSFIYAKKLQACFNTEEDIFQWKESSTLSETSRALANSLGISDAVLEELNVASSDSDSLMFPVFMYDHLMDIRKYNPGVKPKMRSRTNCPAGLIIPYDIWRETPINRVTVLCAGEKDMAVARSHGLNAITFTGGEQSRPKMLEPFRGRPVAICYDNDEAGKTGAIKVATELYGIASSVKIVTGFHEICKEDGEDITDFFTKYHKSKEDLVAYIKAAPVFECTESNRTTLPLVDLLTASKAQYVNKLVRSNVQIVAVSEASFLTPTAIIAEKFKLSGANDLMAVGQTADWELSDDNIQDVLHLIDNNFKETTILDNIRCVLKIPPKEKYVAIKQYSKRPVYKAYVTDMFETTNTETVPMEFTAYSVGCKLESGKKYMVTYKLVPHPYKGAQLTMLITNAVQATDSINDFKVGQTEIEHLKTIQNIEGSVSEKVSALVQKVKGLLGYNGNDTLITAMDLAYHTVLQFNFGMFKDVRGYLDTLIVGESRVGKSSTAEALRKTYELGTFTSLAGNSATIPGLIGGSNKVNGAYQTRAGVIPQNHRGLIIFEEFGKSNNNIMKELTDIRSSNEVRIARVSGTITMPAMVRMITLTNVKSDGTIKPIASYPNGISIITELIGTAEDIARYDMLVVLSDRGTSQINPLWQPEEPLPKEVYQTRVKWVWSRTPDQVILSSDVINYIISKANDVNEKYDCHIKIFGTEAWKKLARLAIAIAGYICSTDDSYENIVVTKECVDYATDFLIGLYDNPTFKLKEFVDHERQYSQIDEDGVRLLQDIYAKTPSLVLQLEQSAATNRNMLAAATGMTNDELNKALMLMTRGLFIRYQMHDIVPTERFRLGMTRINRSTRALRVGEHNA